MVSPEHTFPIMAKHGFRSKPSSFVTGCAASLVAFLFLWTTWSFFVSTTPPTIFQTQNKETLSCDPNLRHEPTEETFYDDQSVSYAIDRPVKYWDEKRTHWLKLHPSFAAPGVNDRVLMVTGSQPTPCKNPIGDHLMLRFFKNKVDYCRIHRCEVFYNNVLLHPKMWTFWAKYPILKSAMLAHPETEWIWWVDADAIFTDMEFRLPLERYKNHNLIVHGWSHLVHDEKSWTGLNAGVFLIRNCQWSMDFIDEWTSMGPQSPDYDKWGKVQLSLFKDKLFPQSDDQAALIYLITQQKQKWANKIYIESKYYFEGYWVEIMPTLGNITDKYAKMERKVPRLRRRHAEKVDERYGALRGQCLKEDKIEYGKGHMSRPFITHFTGCQPCSGEHNTIYSGESCWDGMQKALLFADNQVLRNYGYVHPDLLDPSTVDLLPFDHPAA